MNNNKLLTLLGSICLILVLAALPFMAACAAPSKDEPITLKAVSFIPVFITAVKPLGMLVEKVAEKSNGELTIDWVGGDEVIPMMDQQEAVRIGGIDISILPSNSFTPVMPEANSMFLSEWTTAEERQNGYYDWMLELFKEKANIYYVLRAPYPPGIFYIYTNKKVERPQDIAGTTVISEHMTDAFLEALGAVPVYVDHPEMYSALDAGIVDAQVNRPASTWENSWYEVIKYVIEPGFYKGDVIIAMNLDVWNRLPRHLQDVVKEAALETERDFGLIIEGNNAKAVQDMRDYGMESITFSPEEAKWFLDLAYKSAWETGLEDVSPENYAKLREFLKK